MFDHYTIYQQALDLQASGFDQFSSITVGIGVAKFLQIILPQVAYAVTSLMLSPERVLALLSWISPRHDRETHRKQIRFWLLEYQRLQGFFAWKLGCDLGFFLIVTQYGSWLRAFTWSGLIVYTLLQFVVYYLIGQKLIMANLVRPQPISRPRRIRTTWWKNLGSKLLYEEMGVTINQVTAPLIIAKMVVDYLAMWLTWSAYTIGFFFFANGGLGLSPLRLFPHVSMLSLYISVYLGYAAMFTVAELLLRRLAFTTPLPTWSKRLFLSTQFKQLTAAICATLVLPVLLIPVTNGWKMIGTHTSYLTGVADQWSFSHDGNPPHWYANDSMKPDCDPGCLESEFRKGDYTTTHQ